MEIEERLIKLREDYAKATLDETEVDPDPIVQFRRWLTEAIKAEVPEANAMSLATAGRDGQPSVRVVLLRGFDHNGFVFFTNYQSRKGEQIAENPRGALCFFWPELERQVRIEGSITKVSPTDSDTYFNSRPMGNRLGAWASDQSRPLNNRDELVRAMEAFREKFPDNVKRPPHWGGYRLAAHRIEFWQGRKSRLHDRVEYSTGPNGEWKIRRLAP